MDQKLIFTFCFSPITAWHRWLKSFLEQNDNLPILHRQYHRWWGPEDRFDEKTTSYQYIKSHCGDKTILRPSHLHNGISYTGKMTCFYWIGTLATIDVLPIFLCLYTCIYRSFIQNTTTFTKYCRTQWISKLLWGLKSPEKGSTR